MADEIIVYHVGMLSVKISTKIFLQYPEEHESNRAATALLVVLDRKWRDQCSEAVQIIYFSHSSWVA